MVLMNLFAGQQWRCKRKRTDFWTRGTEGRKEGLGQMESVAWKNNH